MLLSHITFVPAECVISDFIPVDCRAGALSIVTVEDG